MIKFQQNQALTSHFESFWSIVLCVDGKTFTHTHIQYFRMTFMKSHLLKPIENKMRRFFTCFMRSLYVLQLHWLLSLAKKWWTDINFANLKKQKVDFIRFSYIFMTLIKDIKRCSKRKLRIFCFGMHFESENVFVFKRCYATT